MIANEKKKMMDGDDGTNRPARGDTAGLDFFH